jgi:mycothiol synthase
MLACMTAQLPPAIVRVAVEPRSAALALASRAWPETERESQLAAIEQLVAESGAGALILLAAGSATDPVASVLAQVLPGKSAVVWPPQLTQRAPGEISMPLLSALDEHLAHAGVALAQVLLEQAAGPAAALLGAAGYVHAGDLLYMAAEAATFPLQPPAMDLGMEIASPDDGARLARIVEATYQGSLDCPLVDGLRATADVLDGYRAVGIHREDLWWLARWQSSDAGCLLLADHPIQDQMEIVYLGVTPGCRGRNFGLQLTRWAQWQAQQARRCRLVLAVDAANRPAIAAYRTAGFVAWDQRSVFVRHLRLAAKHVGTSI